MSTETNYSYTEAPLTNYHIYDTSNLNYGTPGQIDTGTYELNFKKEWFSGVDPIDTYANVELRKKLEENLPEECFIRDEDGNLKKVTKAEAIEFELKESNITIPQGNGLESRINQYKHITKEQLDEWYKDSMLNQPSSREYVLHTGSAGRDMIHEAMQTAANNWSSLTTENHL